MRRLLRAVMLGVLSATLLHSGTEPRKSVLLLSINGVIHPVTVDMVEKAIAQARRERSELLILQLNTPGGFLDATRAATERILASPMPVVTWVGPAGARAASAGFYLLQAGDVAAMAPGTNTGAAHPVSLVGTPDKTMTQKIENDTAASLRSIVARRARNTQMAEKAVLESRSFTDHEALTNSLIEIVAPDVKDLLKQLNGRHIARFDGRQVQLELGAVDILKYEPTISQRLQMAMSNPAVALGALVIGGLLLYMELTMSGAVLPGVAGAILVLVGLSALSILPVTWLGISLLALALLLFVLEAKIVSHGILGAGGTVAMVLGAMLLVNSPLKELQISFLSAVGLAFPFALILMLLVGLIVRTKGRRAQSGPEAFEGKIATAISDIHGEGKVLFEGEIWNAVAAVDVPATAQVRIQSRNGLTLNVEPVQPATEMMCSVSTRD